MILTNLQFFEGEICEIQLNLSKMLCVYNKQTLTHTVYRVSNEQFN